MSEDSSKGEAYKSAVMTVHLVASILAEHDIPEMLAAIERADATGPLFDPTAWMKKRQAMYEDREVLQAALALHKLGKALKERAATPPAEPGPEPR